MKQKLIILGTKEFAEEVTDLVDECDDLDLDFYGENWDRERCKETLFGKKIIWINDLAQYKNSHKAVCAIGTTKRIGFLKKAEEIGLTFTKVIHPSSRISKTTELGEGSIIGSGVIVASHTKIGKHVIINRGSLIGHHTLIGNFVTISPGSNIGGRVEIGKSTYVGMGAIILNDLKIGSNSIIGAGSVVTKDVPDNVQVVGIPAKIVKENIDGR